jgi:hypothetical protein
MVTALPKHCFEYCGILSCVTFSPGSRLGSIGEFAFRRSGLESIEIPQSVELLSESCFEECARLSKLTFEAGCHLRRFEKHSLTACVGLRSICLPASVELIGSYFLSECSRLKSVTFETGSKLATICESAFLNCCVLGPSIELPAALEVIQYGSFSGCRELSVVRFGPNSALREIKGMAFSGCALASISVPASCVTIHWSCFAFAGKEIDVAFETPAKLQEIRAIQGSFSSFSDLSRKFQFLLDLLTET